MDELYHTSGDIPLLFIYPLGHVRQSTTLLNLFYLYSTMHVICVYLQPTYLSRLISAYTCSAGAKVTGVFIWPETGEAYGCKI